MDKEFIKEILSTEDWQDDRLIKRGDFIDLDFIDYLCTVKTSKIDKAFYRYYDKPLKGESVYHTELKCPCCGNIRVQNLSKTNIIDTIKKIKYKKENGVDKFFYSAVELLCEDCANKKKEKEDREREQYNIDRISKINSETDEYIEIYLDPCNSFKKEISLSSKIRLIMECSYLNDNKIKNAIQNMDYRYFLNTPYWDGVRNYKLKKSKYRCQLCGNKGVLNVHHKNYENHGREHIKSVADSDLIVLCKDCHEKFHDKLDNKVV